MFSIDVGAAGALVASATDGGTDGVLVAVYVGVVLNGLMHSGVDSGRSCIIGVL